jgi:hypothetical protein
MKALSITGADLVRALGEIAERQIDDAVRARAEEVAAEQELNGKVARVFRHDTVSYVVEIAARPHEHADQPPP